MMLGGLRAGGMDAVSVIGCKRYCSNYVPGKDRLSGNAVGWYRRGSHIHDPCA